MFGLGFWEIAIILAVALLVLGPSKLPELAKGLGKGLREFRKATEDFKSTIEDEVYKPEPPKQVTVPKAPQIAEAKIEEPVKVEEVAPPPAAVAAADPIKQADIPAAGEPKAPTES
jgi:TatA/E family protein of Tat protein translocase